MQGLYVVCKYSNDTILKIFGAYIGEFFSFLGAELKGPIGTLDGTLKPCPYAFRVEKLKSKLLPKRHFVIVMAFLLRSRSPPLPSSLLGSAACPVTIRHSLALGRAARPASERGKES